MALAKKCDVCNDYYNHYDEFDDGHKFNGFAFISIDEVDEDVFRNKEDTFDLCPKCMSWLTEKVERRRCINE